MPSSKTVEQVFRQFMNIHWLRPEAGFYKTYDYSILKDILPLPEPSIDICCGDGISSFVWAGGEFDYSFDMYQSVADTVEGMFEGNVDVFDSYRDGVVKPAVTKRPDWNFTVGLDLKETLLQKAAQLDFYQETIPHNLDNPMPTELHNRFNGAFSTTIWPFALTPTEEHDETKYLSRIREVGRILKPGGRFVFRVHEAKFKELMFHDQAEQMGFRWAKRVMRNTWENNPPVQFDIDWWVRSLEANGFTVAKVHNYVPRLIIWFYLIGFRPMFTSFMKMYNLLGPDQRAELKEQWVGDLIDLLEEFADEDKVKQIDPQGGNILYMIEAVKK